MGRRVAYFFRETGAALRRAPLVTLAAVSTVFISLFLLGFSLLVQRQVDLVVQQTGDRVEVSVFIAEEASQEQITRVGDLIQDMPEVETVTFESQEEAFQNARELFRDSPELIENIGPEALPASWKVKLVDPEDFRVIRTRLAGEPGIDQIRDDQVILRRLFAVTNVLRTGVFAVGILMLAAAAGLIGNTVRLALFARRKEIGIMKLVGATNWFIRVPFVIEGVVQGLLGAGAAVFALFIMRVVFIDPLRTEILFTPWIGGRDILFTVPILFGAGVMLAVVASLLAMRRFLEV